jgi:hypothetical protein
VAKSPTRDDRVKMAHEQSVTFDLPHIAGFLSDMLGTALVAYITDVADTKSVNRWANGDRNPTSDHEQRLRATFQIFQLLQAEESPHTVRAWFIGLNPQLDDQSPSQALREGRFSDVLVAAKAYASGG